MSVALQRIGRALTPLLRSSSLRPFSSYNPNLTPLQLDAIRADCYLVDVRQAEELVISGTVPGSHHVPLAELPAQINNFPETNTVFICQSGIRSLVAIDLAVRAGFEEPKHLEGGMNAWNKEFSKPSS